MAAAAHDHAAAVAASGASVGAAPPAPRLDVLTIHHEIEAEASPSSAEQRCCEPPEAMAAAASGGGDGSDCGSGSGSDGDGDGDGHAAVSFRNTTGITAVPYVHRPGARAYLETSGLAPLLRAALAATLRDAARARLALAAGDGLEERRFRPRGWRPFSAARALADHLERLAGAAHGGGGGGGGGGGEGGPTAAAP